MKPKFRFTVVTPCYNSERFIDRVFTSLKKQTFRDFEWYVINDASKDNTHALIEEYIKTVDFEVVYHNLELNQGLHKNINQAIRDARGEFFVLYGHDDEIMPDALETFDGLLKKYDSPQISAVYALANDQNGKLVGKKYPNDEFISDYWTQFFELENEAEKFQCFRTDYLREFYQFDAPEELGLTSGWIWGKVGGKYKAVFVNMVLRIYYTNVQTSITNTMKRNSNPIKVFNYYNHWVNEFQYYIKNNYRRRLRGIGGFVSYGLRSNISFFNMINRVNKTGNKILVIFFFPIALIFNIIKR